MRVFFKAGGFKGQERGWYRFWTSIDAKGATMVFRMPEKASREQVANQAAKKLTHRNMDLNVKVRHSTSQEVSRWIDGHRKKSQTIVQTNFHGFPFNFANEGENLHVAHD